MKRFVFKLEKIRRLREFAEEQAKIELGKAIGILSGIENEIKITAQKRSSATQQRFSAKSSAAIGGDQLDMLAWDNYIARLDRETEELLQKAAEAELVVEQKRGIYLNASSELKVMEKLKEKREQEYRKEYFAAETRELDDLRRVPPA